MTIKFPTEVTLPKNDEVMKSLNRVCITDRRIQDTLMYPNRILVEGLASERRYAIRSPLTGTWTLERSLCDKYMKPRTLNDKVRVKL